MAQGDKQVQPARPREEGHPPRENLEATLPFRRLLGHPLRVGGIDYLNSRPLLEALPAALGPEIEIENHSPSELARRLRSGDLDIALVPVAEFFSGPPEYRIVPGISISSYGPVESIRFFHHKPLREIETVGLDSSSMTSSLLVRLLFAEIWAPGRPAPSFTPISPKEGKLAFSGEDSDFDAILLIGNEALEASFPADWETVDLGTEWTRLTGLPFVYAFWVYRGPPIPGLVEALWRSRDLGKARIDEIVEKGPLPSGMSPAGARRYLCRMIQHELGPAQIEGLLEFQRRARNLGLLAAGGGGNLRFLDRKEK